MPRNVVKQFKVYSFNELPEAGKENALERLWDLNVDHEWYEFIYEDAKQIGAKISGFDLGRGQSIDLELTHNLYDVLQAILNDHGPDTDTHKLAAEYAKAWAAIPRDDDGDQDRDALEALETEFAHELGECYLVMLQREYDYLTSREAVIETIEANGYEFYEDGRIYRE